MTLARAVAAALLLFAFPASAAFLAPNLVKETTTTTGTGTLDLAGAVTGFQDFNAQLATNDTLWYSVYDAAGNAEIGIGTFTDAATDTMARTTVLWSTNANALVNFGAGTKTIVAAFPGDIAKGLVETDYLVGTANSTLTGEIAVGTTPGGELGGSWVSPTIDDGISINFADGSIAGADLADDGVTSAQIADAFTTTNRCMTIETPTDADNLIFFRAESAITIIGIDCITNAATSALVTIQEASGNAVFQNDVETAITCSTTAATESGAMTDAAIDAGDWLRVDVGTVSGSPGMLSVCVTFTVND